jgi:hypothetical protein
MKIVNLILDLSLVGASFWMVSIVRGIGGIVGKTLTTITIGAVVLGLAHITETTIAYLVPGLDTDVGEFIHRIMVFTGFVMLVIGFRQIRELK